MIKNFNYHNTSFLMSAPNINYLPVDTSFEVAFIGYSNVGKSSTLNTLTNQKKLARISKNPGCTQLINLFTVETGIRLIDLPGYGYANVTKQIKFTWKYILYDFLSERSNLKGLVLLMDIRHPMKNFDQQIIYWAINNTMPIIILLTKMDKLSYSNCNMILSRLRKEFAYLNDLIQIELFSSIKKYGIDKLRLKLDNWFNNI